ncbi:MAG: DUF4249 family protein [Bacteroidota bacterium]
MRKPLSSHIAILVSLISLSCNQPFQPEVQYTPELNVYSVLCADANGVYVRVTSVAKSPSDVSLPVHGASVKLVGTGFNITTGGTAPQIVTLSDTTAIIDGSAASFYYAPVHVTPGGSYSISVEQNGYPSVSASAQIPSGYATIPDQTTYSLLQNPKHLKDDLHLTVNLSAFASAEFVQMHVECRGVDSSGNFTVALFNVIPVDSLNPFTEISVTQFQLSVDTTQYQNAFKLASQYAQNLKLSHLYADIIVTQIDDNLYRYFITSTHTATPLLMRTDKIIFTDIFNNAGTGIVAGVSMDTTRIFLY